MTPNLPEAEALCGRGVDESARDSDTTHAHDLAKELFDKYGCAVLVKGGHGAASSAVDVLYDGRDFFEFSMPWIATPASTHGTGCSLAAALAAELALGRGISAAVEGAKAYVHDAIAGSYLVGHDCGVLGFASRSPMACENSPARTGKFMV
jgi:hydroxymethylpyrimidine/phosphomethylpyrimidine kinase